MSDEADVRLVDPHAERDRRDHDHLLGADEGGLVARPHPWLEPGMIRKDGPAGGAELLGQPLRLVAARNVDDPGPRLIGEERLELSALAVAGTDMIADVRPIEAGDDEAVLADAELDQDVAAGALVGGRGQRQPGNFGETFQERPKKPIVGPEVMTPFGNAMGLVDGDQGQADSRDQVSKGFAGGALRRDIDQVQLARLELLDRLGAVGIGGGERRGPNPERLGGADLVVHQGDERRDDERDTLPGQGRHLVAKRLAGSGRHHRQRVAARHDPADHLLLDAAEVLEAERAAKDRKGVGHPRQ